jgi:hypothetical protein
MLLLEIRATLKIGRRIVIPVEAFQLWLISSSQQNKEE